MSVNEGAGLLQAMLAECGQLYKRLESDEKNFVTQTVAEIETGNIEKLEILERLNQLAEKLAPLMVAIRKEGRMEGQIAALEAAMKHCDAHIVRNTRIIDAYVRQVKTIYRLASGHGEERVSLYDRKGQS